ncbi:hypothetical protein LXL04_000065 [Taraxacum kok-saghyz]
MAIGEGPTAKEDEIANTPPLVLLLRLVDAGASSPRKTPTLVFLSPTVGFPLSGSSCGTAATSRVPFFFFQSPSAAPPGLGLMGESEGRTESDVKFV